MAILANNQLGRERQEHAAWALSKDRDLHVVICGYIPRKTRRNDQHFPGHGIGLVASGHGTYRCNNGRVQQIGPGSVIPVYPGPYFSYGPEPEWEEYYFASRGPGLSRWIEYGWFPKEERPFTVRNMPPVLSLFQELMQVLSGSEVGNADRAVAIAERLLIEMRYRRTDLQPEKDRSAIQDVIAYCQYHYSESIDFEALARKHSVSYSSLRHRIRELTGMPPAQYLLAVRCHAARALLADSKLPVKEIADRVGIADPYSFSRIFKRFVGTSPQQFRDQIRQWK
jgi:AraC-like DNA-binding protein